MRLRRSALAGASAALLAAATALPAADLPQALVGRWQLNDKESEDPQAKFRPLRPGEDPNRPDTNDTASRQGDRRGARPARARERTADAPAKLESPPGLLEFLEAPRTLVISSSETQVTVDDGKSPLTLTLGAAESKQGALVVSARSEGQSLIVEKKNEHGARLTIRVSPLPDQKKIEVYERLAGTQGRAVTLRRVYDAAETTS
jgi:hypothetical protein